MKRFLVNRKVRLRVFLVVLVVRDFVLFGLKEEVMKTKKFSVVMHALMFSAMPLVLANKEPAGGLKGIANTIADNMKALAELVGQVAFLWKIVLLSLLR